MTRTPPLPTDAELVILQVLWKLGPSTVRDVLGELDVSTGYTTTLKLLQNMLAKKLVYRDESQRTHVYAARVDETGTLNALIGRLVDRVFGGSGAALALRALGSRPVTPAELAALKRALRGRTEGGATS